MSGLSHNLGMAPSHTMTTQARQPDPIAAPRQAQIVVFCQRPGPLDPLLDWLAEKGAKVVHFPMRRLPLEWFDTYGDSHDVALVDADFLGDEGAMIDFGMRLRRFSPGMPIIMATKRVAQSDYSTERMAICDVTLRMPIARGDLLEALSIALENHSHWLETRHGKRSLESAPPSA